MNRRTRPVLLVLLSAVLFAPAATRPASAQASAAGGGALVLTLEQAQRMALDHNRDVAQAAEFRNYVRGRYVEERAAALPHFTLTANQVRASDETLGIFGGGVFEFPTTQTTTDAGVGLSQTLFTWGQVGAAIRAAKFGMAAADDQLRAYRQAVMRDVTASFEDVLLARELVAIAQENLAQKQRHLDEARRKFALGTATDYDVLAAEVDAANARPALIRTENLVLAARDRLRFLLAIEDREVDVAGRLDAAPGPTPAYDEALSAALVNRPDLQDQLHRTEVYKELVKISRADDKPRFDLSGAYGWKKWDLDVLEADGKTWSVGLHFKFPFFDGLATPGRVAQAKSNFASQQITEARLRDSIGLEVRDAVNALAEAAEILRALSGTVTQAERLRAMAEKGFELGVKTRLEVDDAQTNLIQARGNFARAQRDYTVALATYQYATGTLAEPPASP